MLNIFPRSIGFKLNQLFVNLAIGSINQRINSPKRILKGLGNIEILYRELDFSLSGKTVLEVGTGWHGIDLLIFYLLGAKKIITVDHHRHLHFGTMINQLKYFLTSKCLELLRRLRYSEDRMAHLIELSKHSNIDLEQFLGSISIQYNILPPSEYNRIPINSNSIDLFYSESVLQRIPIKYLRDLMQVIGHKCMTSKAVVFHRTDQKDINSQEHVDTSLWALDYLKYNEWLFNHFLTGKFNYQNRLRESDFLSLLRESGISIVYLESFCKKRDIERLKSFNVAKPFCKKEIQDLAVIASIIVGQKQLRLIKMKRKVVYL